jgi:hypothetical protein
LPTTIGKHTPGAAVGINISIQVAISIAGRSGDEVAGIVGTIKQPIAKTSTICVSTLPVIIIVTGSSIGTYTALQGGYQKQ